MRGKVEKRILKQYFVNVIFSQSLRRMFHGLRIWNKIRKGWYFEGWGWEMIMRHCPLFELNLLKFKNFKVFSEDAQEKNGRKQEIYLVKWEPGNIVSRFLLSFPSGLSNIRIQLGIVLKKCKFQLHSSVFRWKWESLRG